MPVIHTHVSVSTTPEQREALKAAYGRAITAVPGKSEGWLMCPFEDNMPIYFGGSDDQPAAYVEVNVFGRSVPSSAWEKLTQNIMAALNSTLGVPEDRTYIRYTATTDWGWNGGNFKLLYLAPGGGVVEHSETGGGVVCHGTPPQSASLPTRPQITGSLSFAFLLQTAPPGCLLNVSTSKRGFET